jgi:hypothetical protein
MIKLDPLVGVVLKLSVLCLGLGLFGLGVLSVPCAFVQVCIAWTAMMSLLPKKEKKKRNKKRKRTCGELPY